MPRQHLPVSYGGVRYEGTRPVYPEDIRASMLPHIIQTIPLDDATACRLYNLPLYAVSQLRKEVA